MAVGPTSEEETKGSEEMDQRTGVGSIEMGLVDLMDHLWASGLWEQGQQHPLLRPWPTCWAALKW